MSSTSRNGMRFAHSPARDAIAATDDRAILSARAEVEIEAARARAAAINRRNDILREIERNDERIIESPSGM